MVHRCYSLTSPGVSPCNDDDVREAGTIMFRVIPPAECVPPSAPVLSLREQTMAAVDMDLPSSHAHKVKRMPCVTLPGYARCVSYSRWFEDNELSRRARECPDLPRVLVICEDVERWRGAVWRDCFKGAGSKLRESWAPHSQLGMVLVH